jgi:glycosyltransferase involved in cell wall biosynthesis
MKNILIDISIAHNNFSYVSGAGEYALVILKALAARKDINLFISAKSSNSYQEEIKRFSKPENYIFYEDYTQLSSEIESKNIHTVYFPQLLDEHINICIPDSVRIVATLHDLGNILESELDSKKVFGRFYDWNLKQKVKMFIKRCLRVSKTKNLVKKQLEVLHHFKHLELVTVSYYSKATIACYLGYHDSNIHVFYSPMKISQEYSSNALNDSIKAKYKIKENQYFLFCNASRTRKNNTIALVALDNFFSDTGCDYKAVVLGSNKCYKTYIETKIKNKDQFIFLPYADNEVFEQLYKFAHLFVFPSLIEGFGYPPIEAMKYGTLCAVSTACSIPEVVQNGAIFFDPLDKKSIELAYYLSFDKNYTADKTEASEQIYRNMSSRQESDFSQLISLIIEE